MVYLITGKAGAGKSHYVEMFASELEAEGCQIKVIDGDRFRKETKNQDFTDKGRIRNLDAAASLAREYEEQGYIVLCAFVSPKRVWRDMMRRYWKESIVVYIPGGKLWEGTTYERPEPDELKLLKTN